MIKGTEVSTPRGTVWAYKLASLIGT